MAQRKSPKQLSKILFYMLGHRPDEFGLVLNPDGFIKIKQVLKAVCEEAGWKYVRRSHIDEILISIPDPPFEIDHNLIRAKERDRLPKQVPAQNLPKVLYTCVRQKAHPFVMEKGISPAGFSHVILSSNREMADKIGKRSGSDPVLLTVNVKKSIVKGIQFYQAGEALYLAESIHAGCFSGPPVPKQKMEIKRPAEKKEDASPRLHGSYIMDLEERSAHKTRDRQKKKRKDFKKKKRERPPWRS
ncbi:MAG: RNA 2'-phosphotransferase [Deltaproteobacteria bacterium]|nr:RNA 2'-phosphotransferase [Deltaproteobacteria bacterium]